MAWTERQLALLEALGLPVWQDPAAEGLAEAAVPEHAIPEHAVAQDAAPEASVAEIAIPSQAVVPAVGAAARAVPSRAEAPVAAAPRPVAPVRSPALAALGWDELQATVAACRACGLCESRTQTVFGVGHRQAQWMVVGEAPGQNEDLQGEPFVGAAGQLLDRMLAALKLTRSAEGDVPLAQRVYIANTLKCRPPSNRNPSPEELAKCEPYLVRQIELLQPRIILAMGKFAVQTLLRSDEAIGRLRGRVHRYQGVPVVVTYHPAYLLRSPAEKAKAWEDLCLAADVADGVAG